MIEKYTEKMQKSVDNLEKEYNSIRAGRANPHVLDKIKVDYYGTPTPLQQVGNISVPEPRILCIQPWETSLLKSIEKAIQQSDVGIHPTNDGKMIRLIFPELTEHLIQGILCIRCGNSRCTRTQNKGDHIAVFHQYPVL